MAAGPKLLNPETENLGPDMGIVLHYCQYGVQYLGSYYNTGPYIDFPHFGNSNLGELPHDKPSDLLEGLSVARSGLDPAPHPNICPWHRQGCH